MKSPILVLFLYAGLGSMVNTCRAGDESCLHLAVEAGSREIVQMLVAESADVNKQNSLFQTPLFVACKKNLNLIALHLLKQ